MNSEHRCRKEEPQKVERKKRGGRVGRRRPGELARVNSTSDATGGVSRLICHTWGSIHHDAEIMNGGGGEAGGGGRERSRGKRSRRRRS